MPVLALRDAGIACRVTFMLQLQVGTLGRRAVPQERAPERPAAGFIAINRSGCARRARLKVAYAKFRGEFSDSRCKCGLAKSGTGTGRLTAATGCISPFKAGLQLVVSPQRVS